MRRKTFIFIGAIAIGLVAILAFRPPFVRGIYHDAMFAAVWDSRPAVVRFLLLLGADPDGASDHRYSFIYGGFEFSPHIYSAISHRDCAVLRLLMDSGADIHYMIADGATPISSAIHDHNPEAVRLLLAAGASPYHSSSWTAADQARKLGHGDLLPIIEPYLTKTP